MTVYLVHFGRPVGRRAVTHAVAACNGDPIRDLVARLGRPARDAIGAAARAGTAASIGAVWSESDRSTMAVPIEHTCRFCAAGAP